MANLEARQKLGGIVLKAQKNQCPICMELFNSDAAFDKHRKPIAWFVGIKEESKSLPSIPRRCLSVEEMQGIGMTKNNFGFWVTASMPDSVLGRIKEDKEEQDCS